MRRTGIVVADASPIFRAGVRHLLARESDFEVFEAASYAELAAAVSAHEPDIALVDLELPTTGGVAAVSRLARHSTTSMILWSFEATTDTILAAITAGAKGYLPKEISPSGLIRSLRGVIRGEAPISRELATVMVDAVHGLEERDRVRERAVVLSAREREVLALVARGDRNRQIAQALSISEFTVKRHMQNILHKLNLPSRRAAGLFYRSAFESEQGAVSVMERTG
ncbi:MAG: response regulator transcription factor [Gaiellaceae bacterium]